MALNKPRKRVVAAITTAVFLASGLTVSMTADSSAATVPNRFWCKPSGVGGGWCYRVNKYAPGCASSASGSTATWRTGLMTCTTPAAPFLGVPAYSSI